MTQLPQHLWNEIATANPSMLTSWGAVALNLEEDQVDRVLEEQARVMLNRLPDVTPKTATAYQTVLPLLVEHRAIQVWLLQTRRADLMPMLPEILTVEEAVELAATEYGLTFHETRALSSILPSPTEGIRSPAGKKAAMSWIQAWTTILPNQPGAHETLRGD